MSEGAVELDDTSGPPAGPGGSRALLLGAFFLSGAAGLTYEAVWSRYLALLLGHSAYAQVVVIAVYLGGMAVGALLVGDVSKRLRRPLHWYVGAEVALAVAGLAFHPVFRRVSDLSYETLIPAFGSSALGSFVPWVAAVGLVLPQAVLLGATFPLMAAGVLRAFRRGAGRTVADVYLWNTLGGAVGVLVTGFWTISAVGTFGSLAVAAAANLLAAGAAWLVAARIPAERAGRPWEAAAGREKASGPAVDDPEVPPSAPGPWPGGPGLWWLFLGVSFLTAVASFVYEIGWIRMLSLVMGSATHAFELMLSAFILGLALGSWLIRGWVDTAERPVELLGIVQWGMGLTAVATLPLYMEMFPASAYLVNSLPADDTGYALFNLSRYAIGLLIMMPSTVLAGMTLPLITGTLLRAGMGERAVGWVYGVNTFGSVSGVVAAGLILLPLLGLKGMLVAAATLDMALGVVLLGYAAFGSTGTVRLRWAASGGLVGTLLVVLAVGWGVELDRGVLTSGVYRFGYAPAAGEREVLFYHDGRTASVGVHVLPDQQFLVLSTNGKPDASLPFRWMAAAVTEDPPVAPIRSQDASTQTLAPLVLLAHAPDASTGANIGHGSGMSAHALLGSPSIEELVTVEIEPAIVRGSGEFYPANGRPFDDVRHRFVFDDARSWFAHEGRRFDFIFSEPSNPWVSGTASLFTVEFYRRIRRHLSEGGLFAQWMQLYEMNDELLLTVLVALDLAFDDYRAYLVGDSDMLIVAGREPVPDPDWSVFDHGGVREALHHVPPFEPHQLRALELFRRSDLEPLMARLPVAPNSDFEPRLDLGAEAARFRGDFARGTYTLVSNRFDLLRTLRRERRPRPRPAPVPVWGLEPMREQGLAAWLGEHDWSDTDPTPPPYSEWGEPWLRYREFMSRLRDDPEPTDWRSWTVMFEQVESDLHAATAGWADEEFFGAVEAYLARTDPPEEVRRVVDFFQGVARWDFERTAEAADFLARRELLYAPLLNPSFLLDGAVVAYLALGRVADAREVYELLVPRTDRQPGNLRNRILDAVIREAEP